MRRSFWKKKKFPEEIAKIAELTKEKKKHEDDKKANAKEVAEMSKKFAFMRGY